MTTKRNWCFKAYIVRWLACCDTDVYLQDGAPSTIACYKSHSLIRCVSTFCTWATLVCEVRESEVQLADNAEARGTTVGESECRREKRGTARDSARDIRLRLCSICCGPFWREGFRGTAHHFPHRCQKPLRTSCYLSSPAMDCFESCHGLMHGCRGLLRINSRLKWLSVDESL